MRRAARVYGAGAAGLCMAALSVGVLAAAPASAKATASMHLTPGHGPAGTAFTATMQIAGGPGGQCPGGVVSFSFDSQPMGSAGVDPATCTTSIAVQVPAGTPAGAHRVHGALSGGTTSASASSTFTVDQSGQTPPPSATAPPSSVTLGTPPGNSSSTAKTTTGTPSSTTPTWYNTITPTTPWTAPAFAPRHPATPSTACDTSGDHAPDAKSGFLLVEDYAAGKRITPSPGPLSNLVNEPLASHVAITSVGPDAMTPPKLGTVPYESLEIIEPYDPAVSPKLQLAAAAGEPLGCVKIEVAGAAGSGYGYLVYALKGALVVSSQELDPPTPEATPSAATPAKAAKPTTPAAPATPAKPRFVRLVLGYSSVSWEYQEAGSAQAPIHRGEGTIVPPPPAGTLSYSNLVFAFGGLIAATVALMFAYHSRRRELLRRGRRASHA